MCGERFDEPPRDFLRSYVKIWLGLRGWFTRRRRYLRGYVRFVIYLLIASDRVSGIGVIDGGVV